MGRRGRPSLNISPEERLQRRRSQLVASQRKRRAHQRLLSLPSASASEQPCVATSEALPPAVPTVLPAYDAMSGDAVVTDTAAIETSSPNARSPLPAIRHRCGSAPLDTAAMPAPVSPASAASLLWTRQLGTETDTYALPSRLASPMPTSSTWARHTNTNEPDDAGTDKASSSYIASHASLFDRGLDSSDCVGSNTLLVEELETNSTRLKRPAHAFAPGMDVFFPGRATSTADSEWIPSSSRFEDEGPMLAGATLCGPTLRACSPMSSDDGFGFWTPWTGAKQAIPMGF